MDNEKIYTPRGFEIREHVKYYQSSMFGRSTCRIDCPFCGDRITAYIWSLAGCGKRCTCGVIHTSFNCSIDDKNKFGGMNEVEGKKRFEEELARRRKNSLFGA